MIWDLLLRFLSFLLLLLTQSCNASDIIVPPDVAINKPSEFKWNAKLEDYKEKSPSGFFGGVLTALADCPEGNSTKIGVKSTNVIVDDLVVDLNPTADVPMSLTLTPNTAGPHRFCIYGNVPKEVFDLVNGNGNRTNTSESTNTSTASQTNSNSGDGNQGVQGFPIGQILNEVIVIDKSGPFNVSEAKPPSSSGTATDSPNPSQSGDGNGHGTNKKGKDKFKEKEKEKDHTAEIAGGIAGGVAVVLLILAIYLYRRLHHQRKINQFHREHVLFNQQPPSSLMASSLHSPRALSSPPPPTYIAGPLSPQSTIRAGNHNSIPLGYDDAMHKTYSFPRSEKHHASPSMYSVTLPTATSTEPLRAQHPNDIV